MKRSKRSQEHPALINAIRNDNISDIAKWVKVYGIDYPIVLETTDLVSNGRLLNATILNVAIMLKRELVAVWALRSGASHNVAVLISQDSSDPAAVTSEQEQHPLMAAIMVKMPKTVEALVDQKADAGYQQTFRVKKSGRRKVRQEPIWRMIANCPEYMKFCETFGLHKLLQLIADDNFTMYIRDQGDLQIS